MNREKIKSHLLAEFRANKYYAFAIAITHTEYPREGVVIGVANVWRGIPGVPPEPWAFTIERGEVTSLMEVAACR